MDARHELAKPIDCGAAWRTARSAEDPTDDRSRRSADALVELAGYVKTLPPNDRRFDAITGLDFDQHDFPGTDDDVDKLITRYGSNPHLQSHPDTFLRELVAIADRGARSRRRSRMASAKAAEPPRREPDVPGPSDRIASDFDPAGTGSDFDPAGPRSDFDPAEGGSDFDPAGGGSDFDPAGPRSDFDPAGGNS